MERLEEAGLWLERVLVTSHMVAVQLWLGTLLDGMISVWKAPNPVGLC